MEASEKQFTRARYITKRKAKAMIYQSAKKTFSNQTRKRAYFNEHATIQ
jgi:hypothetical protein